MKTESKGGSSSDEGRTELKRKEDTAVAASVINVLDEHIANKIAAGEVIERPASVVKELVENALDAGATRVEVDIRAGGKEYIRVTDDGAGIGAEQVPLAFERHATSKIAAADDLFNVATLGFRGEALPSIAAVAAVEVRSRTKDEPGGVAYTVNAGRPGSLQPIGTPVGTTVIVRQLFFNTPARYKFLRSDTAERRRVVDVVARIALAWPSVALRLVADGRELFATPGDDRLLSAIGAIYGHDNARSLVKIDLEQDGLHADGYVSKPDTLHGNRDRMSVFLNQRWIQSGSILHAIQRGYETLLPPRRFPLAVVRLTVDAAAVDVNVHPAKAEVRFQDDGAVYRTVMRAVRYGLLDANLVGGFGVGGASEGGFSGARGPETAADGAAPQQEAGRDDAGSVDAERMKAYEQTRSSNPENGTLPAGTREALQTRLPPSGGGRLQSSHQHDPTGATYGSIGDDATYIGRLVSLSKAHGIRADRASSSDIAPATAADARTQLREMAIIGQLQRTFILGETSAGLWIVDQHVAHERILYELFLVEGAAAHAIQQLLVPVPVTLTPDRIGLVEQFGAKLEHLGFTLEPFGGASYLVRGVPVAFAGTRDAGRLTTLLEEVLDACVTNGRWDAHEAAAALSCRAAIKAGQTLNGEQMRQLIVQLADADNPFACPHGRPIVIEVSRPDLERRFGRR